MPAVMLQMSLFNQYFDSWLAQGPPIGIQKLSGFILRPLARISGYRSYYPEFAPQKNISDFHHHYHLISGQNHNHFIRN
jgi:hypothetical protein